VNGADDGCILASDETIVRGAAEFREIWDMGYALEKLSGRRGIPQWRLLNEDVFIE
jgi:hypothetical protein